MLRYILPILIASLSLSNTLAQHRATVVGAGYIVDKGFNKVDRLDEGDTIIAISTETAEYTKVRYKRNKVGLLRTSNISWIITASDSLIDTLSTTIYTSKPMGAPIRKTPDVDGTEVSYCKNGEPVQLIAYVGGNYYKIKHGPIVGYINIAFLKHSKVAVDSINSFPIERGGQRLQYEPISSTPTPRGTSGRVYHTGPRGGRYYINSNGNKVYIKKD